MYLNRDDVIRMAQEAGYINFQFTSVTTLERFAKLIAAAEREACAKVCDQRAEEDTFEGGYANACAEAIRARGQ